MTPAPHLPGSVGRIGGQGAWPCNAGGMDPASFGQGGWRGWRGTRTAVLLSERPCRDALHISGNAGSHIKN